MMTPSLRFTVLLSLVVLAGALLLMRIFLPALPQAHLLDGAANQWQLPEMVQADPAQQIEQLISRNLWKEPVTGGTPAEEQKPLTTPDWRIVAVVKSGGVNQLVLSFKDNPSNLQNLKVGEQLPGGIPILRIEQNWVVVAIGKKHYMLSVGRN